MAQSSALGYWEYAPTSAFNDGEPVSPLCTQRLVNNLNHLYDEQAQHRINWVSRGVGAEDNIGLSTGSGTVRWEAVVPWMMTRDEMPANADYYVAGATSNAANPTTLTLRMLPFWATFEEADATSFFTSTSPTTTSTTGAYALDFRKIFNIDDLPKLSGLMKACIHEFKTENADGEILATRLPLVKFIVEASNPLSQPYIMGVSIREFV